MHPDPTSQWQHGTAAPAPHALYSYAFQPIVDTVTASIFSYEALIRGPNGESAASVFERIAGAALHQFDGDSRVAAMQLARRLGLGCKLNLNFLPHSLYTCPDSLQRMLAAARATGIEPERLILEVTEEEAVHDPAAFARAINELRRSGVNLAIDDFGAGYAGLAMLADFQPDIIKLDMKLVRGIDGHGPRQAIVRAVGQACTDLGIDVIAEGIETPAEWRWLEDSGIRLFQGHLFGRPEFESLPQLRMPELIASPGI
jgi:EAL domain-containing protein (putative c-di-GMP-specific phosphodiesterase class I)